jgi:hypothetical protein
VREFFAAENRKDHGEWFDLLAKELGRKRRGNDFIYEDGSFMLWNEEEHLYKELTGEQVFDYLIKQRQDGAKS